MRPRSLLLISALVAICQAATDDTTTTSQYNPLRYIPSKVLTTIGLAFYVPVTIAMFFLIFTMGANYMFYMAVGSLCYCAGLALRYPFHSHPYGLGLYIGMNMLTVLSPCAFIAAIYMLLGRLARELGMGKYLLVKPDKLAKYFVISDCTTFFIQGSGGGLLSSKTTSMQNLGKHLFLIGLVLQLVSFGIFTLLLLVWMHKVHKHSRSVWLRDELAGKSWHRDWRAMAGAILVSCVGVLVRSVFRVVENSQGFSGQLTSTESYFYLLDSLPLFIAIAVYIPFWPANFISDDQSRIIPDEENTSSHELAAGVRGGSGGPRDQYIPVTTPFLKSNYPRNGRPRYSR
ncbi:hypothetical protein FRB95_008951 [Tulasnella sp. JGI-2019a]|nr:hypothetical protein FRB95_008951 [Tulasnella sp. JGI-2019a]